MREGSRHWTGKRNRSNFSSEKKKQNKQNQKKLCIFFNVLRLRLLLPVNTVGLLDLGKVHIVAGASAVQRTEVDGGKLLGSKIGKLVDTNSVGLQALIITSVVAGDEINVVREDAQTLGLLSSGEVGLAIGGLELLKHGLYLHICGGGRYKGNGGQKGSDSKVHGYIQ